MRSFFLFTIMITAMMWLVWRELYLGPYWFQSLQNTIFTNNIIYTFHKLQNPKHHRPSIKKKTKQNAWTTWQCNEHRILLRCDESRWTKQDLEQNPGSRRYFHTTRLSNSSRKSIRECGSALGMEVRTAIRSLQPPHSSWGLTVKGTLGLMAMASWR